MRNVLKPTKQQQILALGQLGWPVSRIAASVGVDRETVTRYVRAARSPERSPSKTRNFVGGVHRPAAKSHNFVGGGVHRLATEPRAAGECV